MTFTLILPLGRGNLLVHSPRMDTIPPPGRSCSHYYTGLYGPISARMELGEKINRKVEYDGETRNHFRFTSFQFYNQEKEEDK